MGDGSGTNSNSDPGSPNTPGPSRGYPPVFSNQQQSTDASMEVEDSNEKQSNISGVDVDSGIENMEVEDSDRKEPLRSRVRMKRLVLQPVVYNLVNIYENHFRLQAPVLK